MTAYNKLDGVMLGSLINDHNYQAGIYATAYRFYDAANMIGYMFAALLLPMFAANAEQMAVLNTLLDVGLKYVVITAVMIILSCFYYGDIIMAIMFDDYTSEFFIVLRILISSYLMVAIAYIFGTMLVACGKVKTLNYIFGIGLLVNIVLNIILIPRYQAIGAALSTLITQSFVMIGQVIIVRMSLKIGIQLKEILRLILFTVLSTVIFIGFKSMTTGHWYLILGISILICLLLSFILKILDKDEIIQIFRKNQ
ncbi:MAG: polysaccharide biosynthesis C-terminal domain-containing protein [Saprospiraceae bacterium]|nr:polysaccharide biosynthesis C-terminal domain-containing protein [Saprospiraceae bacterium]